MRLTRRSPMSGLALGHRMGMRTSPVTMRMWPVTDAGTHKPCLRLGGSETTSPSKRAMSSGRGTRDPEGTDVGTCALILDILHPAARSPFGRLPGSGGSASDHNAALAVPP